MPDTELTTNRSRLVTWHDPAWLTDAAAALSGREFLQALVEGRLPAPPMAELIGARLVFVGDGEVRFAWTPDESTYNTIGMVHGGLLCTLLDFAAGAAVHTRLPAGVGFSSIEIKVSYLKHCGPTVATSTLTAERCRSAVASPSPRRTPGTRPASSSATPARRSP